MTNKDKVPSKIIEYELQIKLLEYLNYNNYIDEGMYNFVINKLINKISSEKNKNNNDNYKLVT